MKSLAAALKHSLSAAEVTSITETLHGKRYIVIGRVESPYGKAPLVRSIGIVDKELDTARLVTAYPCKE